MDFARELALAFVPIFVAMDAIGNTPIIIAAGEGSSPQERRRIVNLAMLTASALGVAFLLAGEAFLRVLGIKVGHFAIAGGLILLVLALKDLTLGKMLDVPPKEEMMAVVPLGTPLTVGPATLTTLLLLNREYSLWIVLLALALNLVFTWVVFTQAQRLADFLGHGGIKAVTKVISLLLAAIGVRMVFYGLGQVLPLGG